MMKNDNNSSLIRLLIMATVLIALISMISTSSALSVNLSPGQSIKDITTLCLGFDNNAELNLAPGTYNNTNDQDISTGSGNVTIKGTNSSQKSIIDLKGNNRFFTVNSGSTLKLENLVIKNCKINGDGGVVLNSGEIIINNCEFINNTANNGGVIYSDSPSITINNSIFTDNTAQRGGVFSGHRYFYFDYYSVNIVNSKFFNNKADFTGGVVDLDGVNLTVSGCDFYNNSAGWSGGAIYSIGLAFATIKIFDSLFYNNSAGWSGGAYFSMEGDLIINNSYFIANKAETGGAIYHGDQDVNITFCKFYDNSANWNGGAISVSAITNIAYCDFIGNMAGGYGGAIVTYSSLTSIFNFFLNNIAYIDGNDIW